MVKLPSSVQIQVYRIAQEALSNICRHAKASHVKMTVNAAKDGMFELKIEDNGSGFDAKETKKKPGRGVANIRARASMIEAEVSWARRDGGGTVFELNKKQLVD
jgi:protein-histidine pros-kinase